MKKKFVKNPFSSFITWKIRGCLSFIRPALLIALEALLFAIIIKKIIRKRANPQEEIIIIHVVVKWNGKQGSNWLVDVAFNPYLQDQ